MASLKYVEFCVFSEFSDFSEFCDFGNFCEFFEYCVPDNFENAGEFCFVT